MRSVRSLVRALATIAALTLLALLAPPASGAVITVCDDRLEYTRVVGDVLVPAGAFCEVTRVAITGDLRVEGVVASFVSSEVKGDTVVEVGSLLVARAATLHDVDVRDGELYFSQVTVHGDVRGTVEGVDAHRSDVRGTIALTAAAADVEFPAVWLTESRVAGDVLVRDRLLVLFASSVGGRAEVIEAPAPGPEPGSYAVLVCRSTVGGELRVARSHDIVAIDGHPYSDNPFFSPCPEQAPTPARSTFGSVKLVDNFHSITVGDATVTGDLRCYNNVGPRGVDSSAATVLGTRYGQCGTAP